MLVKPMRGGVTTTVLIDCCHSGSVLDLPYESKNLDEKLRMERQTGFNMEIITKAVRPLSKEEKRQQKQMEREARRAARAAERLKRKEEEAKREPTITYIIPAEDDIQAARQKLMKEAQENAMRQTGRNVVMSVGPVQHVSGTGTPPISTFSPSVQVVMKQSSPNIGSSLASSASAPREVIKSYKVMVPPAAVSAQSTNKAAKSPARSPRKPQSATRKLKSNKLGGLISKFESNS